MSSIITILIRPATLLHKSIFLIGFLTLLTPLRCLVLAILLLFIAFFLRLMDSATIVLSRAVHSHELQRLSLRSVDELMLSASGHDNDVGGFDVLLAILISKRSKYTMMRRE
jgi:hypothetical protein